MQNLRKAALRCLTIKAPWPLILVHDFWRLCRPKNYRTSQKFNHLFLGPFQHFLKKFIKNCLQPVILDSQTENSSLRQDPSAALCHNIANSLTPQVSWASEVNLTPRYSIPPLPHQLIALPFILSLWTEARGGCQHAPSCCQPACWWAFTKGGVLWRSSRCMTKAHWLIWATLPVHWSKRSLKSGNTWMNHSILN